LTFIGVESSDPRIFWNECLSKTIASCNQSLISTLLKFAFIRVFECPMN